MYGLILLSYSNFVRKVIVSMTTFETFDFENSVTLRVREGHWKYPPFDSTIR